MKLYQIYWMYNKDIKFLDFLSNRTANAGISARRPSFASITTGIRSATVLHLSIVISIEGIDFKCNQIDKVLQVLLLWYPISYSTTALYYYLY